MPLLTPSALSIITPKLRLKAKLQSLKWQDKPEELEAFFRNLNSFIYKDAISHGAYSTHVTTFNVGDVEFCRFTLKHNTNSKYIPSIEAFLDPYGKIYFHIVWTALGVRDKEVDDYIAEHFVNYICHQFEEPVNHIAIIIHRRWKLNRHDITAKYDCVEWGNQQLCLLAHDLIRKQQGIARTLRNKLAAKEAHLQQVLTALETKPDPDTLTPN